MSLKISRTERETAASMTMKWAQKIYLRLTICFVDDILGDSIEKLFIVVLATMLLFSPLLTLEEHPCEKNYKKSGIKKSPVNNVLPGYEGNK